MRHTGAFHGGILLGRLANLRPAKASLKQGCDSDRVWAMQGKTRPRFARFLASRDYCGSSRRTASSTHYGSVWQVSKENAEAKPASRLFLRRVCRR